MFELCKSAEARQGAPPQRGSGPFGSLPVGHAGPVMAGSSRAAVPFTPLF